MQELFFRLTNPNLSQYFSTNIIKFSPFINSFLFELLNNKSNISFRNVIQNIYHLHNNEDFIEMFYIKMLFTT